jgi:hypothetical protein
MKDLKSLLQKIFIEESKAERSRVYGLDPELIRGFQFRINHAGNRNLHHTIHSFETYHGKHKSGNIFRDVNLLVGLTNSSKRNIIKDPEYIKNLSSSLTQLMPQEKFTLDRDYQDEIDQEYGSMDKHGVIALKSRIIAPQELYTYDWSRPHIDRPGGDPRTWSSQTG